MVRRRRSRPTTAKRRKQQTIATWGLICYICEDAVPIDLKLPNSDPKSFSVDHVIPTAKGGQDTLANWRPAHKKCNEDKGHKGESAWYWREVE